MADTGFNGNLIQIRKEDGSAVADFLDFPMKYVKAESYKVTSNQRLESEAARGTDGKLHRTTLAHTASKIDINLIVMTNTELESIWSIIRTCFLNENERKVYLKYYDPETNAYKEGYFYIPDIDYPILRIDTAHNIIHYDSIRIAFIEY